MVTLRDEQAIIVSGLAACIVTASLFLTFKLPKIEECPVEGLKQLTLRLIAATPVRETSAPDVFESQQAEAQQPIAPKKPEQATQNPITPSPKAVKPKAVTKSAKGKPASEQQPAISQKAPVNKAASAAKTSPAVAASTRQTNQPHHIPLIINPQYISRTLPTYPKRAIQLGYEGTAILHVLIDEHGLPQQLRLVDSSGHEMLDKQALKAVQKWHMRPYKVDGIAQMAWVKIPVEFKLQ